MAGELKSAGRGFKSFEAFKRAMGPAGLGQAWHHIVEQNSANIAKFGAEAIHNTNNLIKLPNRAGEIHRLITGHYNSLIPGSSIRYRDYVNELDFHEQFQYGMKKLLELGY